MKKKIVLISVISILASLCVLCVVFYLKHQKAQARIAQVPGITLRTMDGQMADLAGITRGKVSVILFFHPSCAFCGMEMKEILAHRNELEGINMVFVTTAEDDELTDFLEEYPIDEIPDGTVLTDHLRDFVITYNIKSPPTCFIYNSEQNLQKTIRGTTPVSEIIEIIDNLR